MAWGWSKTRYSPIAVDFGTDSLKLLQLISSEPPQLIAAASIELPEHARLDPASRSAFLVESLRDLVRSHGFKGRRAICSVPAYQTLVRHLQVSPADDQAGVEAQINQYLLERLNIDPSRMVVRHFEVGQVIRDGSKKHEVICLAASREAAMGCIEIAQRAKLDVVGMHSEPLAILRAFDHLNRVEKGVGRVVCFVDIGWATTKVVITHGTDMKFTKMIHVAGDHFTRHVAQAENMAVPEARAKRRQDLAVLETAALSASTSQGGDRMASGSDQVAVSGPGHTAAAVTATQDAGQVQVDLAPSSVQPTGHRQLGESLDCLLDELQLCIRYHQSTFPDRPIEKLVFLGGESRHVWMCQRIARTLRIGAQLGDPMARLVRINQSKESSGVDLRVPQPGWAVPVGLCLSEANL